MTVVRFREWARPRLLLIALVVAAIAQIAYQAAGASTFLPRFKSDDPREVVTAYYEAQRWGFRTLAEQALSPAEQDSRAAPNHVRPLIADTLWASDLAIADGADTGFRDQYDDERLYVVTYESHWRSGVGDPPGERMWFVWVGRDSGEPWHILSEGTGP